MKSRSLAWVLMLAACGDDPASVPIRFTDRPWALSLAAGHRYRLRYPGPIDSAPLGTAFAGATLADSPLAPMKRPALIFKTDDFGNYIAGTPARYLQTVADAGGVASLGLITSALPNDDQTLEGYRALAAHGFEPWFHGHTHQLHPKPEFQGTGIDAQEDSFTVGLARAQEALGLQLRSFGAPGNGFDEDTVDVVREFPQIVVWLFGPEGASAVTLPRLVDAESSPGVIADPAGVLAKLDAELPTAEVVTLQLHPGSWNETSFERFGRLLDTVVDEGAWRLTTPHAWWCWLAFRQVVTLTKVGTTDYELDLTNARCDEQIEVDVTHGVPQVEALP